MAAKTICLILHNNAVKFMLISEKTTGSINIFFASKEAYLIVRQLENITVKKSASQNSKMR